MNIPVLIEPVPGNGFRATGAEPFAAVAEGATPDEALARLRESVERRLQAGARVVSLPLSAPDHSWLPFAGMFHGDDPIVQQWLEVLQSRRREPEAA
jgi:predicted RNase H-like HicB family nuclease